MLRMSSYAGASLRSAGFICTPCRLLLARRTAPGAAASLAVIAPRLLNPPRLRTYSDKPTPTADVPPEAAPKRKRQKKSKSERSKSAPAKKTDDNNNKIRSDSDVAMIQEALKKIKSALLAAGHTETKPEAKGKAKSRGKTGKAKSDEKTAKARSEEKPAKAKSEEKPVKAKGPKMSLREAIAKPVKLWDPSQTLVPKAKAERHTLPEKKEPAIATKLATFLTSKFGQKTWDEAQITEEDRASVIRGIKKAASGSTTAAALLNEEKKKRSPLLSHLDDVKEAPKVPELLQESGQGKKKKKKKKENQLEIMTVHGKQLELTAIEREQPPVPGLSYGLDRVLFNPGVYHMQDPRSRVFNFDPYLAGIMPVKEFDFDALKQYVTSSKDTTLIGVAAEHGKKYAGSTSSMTSMLAHFHYLLSSWRPINTDNLTRAFPVDSTNFTMIQRCPAAIFLHWKDGTYAIDADKEFDTANVLSMLGKSMEKLLTLPKEDFEKYRRVNSSQLTEEERNADESYHYTTMGDFMMRSQLDAHDPRIPGTGMFDLKTRAVVSIRMDAQAYLNGVGYEIRKRFGQWESYEREYYDMIRSAFLKYSLQVRMGRMDGIFVAFHNTQRIFGFQYIPLSEMDQSLHGTSDTTLGDQEFKISLNLLNTLLDRATAKWPKQSLRLHFETRPSETAFMYVFATPVTPEQIEEVQNKNKAEVERFEREMMGIIREEDSEIKKAGEQVTEDEAREEEEEEAEEEDEEEETSLDVWEDMRTKVEETLENDELGADFVRDVMEDALEESGMLRTGSHDEKESYLDAIMEVITIGSQVKQGEEGAKKSTSEPYMAEDGSIEEAAVEDDKPVDEVATQEPESVARAEQEGSTTDTDEGYESEAKDDEAVSLEEAANAEGPSLKDLIIRLAAKSKARSTGHSGVLGEAEDDLTSDEQRLRKFEHILYQMVEKTHEMKSSVTEEQDIAPKADSELEVLTEDAADEVVDSYASDADVLGIILTLRNKVNGDYVDRPEMLSQDSQWTVEYAIEELPEARASALYTSCIARREKSLARKTEQGSNSKFDAHFKANLMKLSSKGRAFRLRETEKAKQRPVHVYGTDGSLKYNEVFSETGEPMAESRVGK